MQQRGRPTSCSAGPTCRRYSIYVRLRRAQANAASPAASRGRPAGRGTGEDAGGAEPRDKLSCVRQGRAQLAEGATARSGSSDISPSGRPAQARRVSLVGRRIAPRRLTRRARSGLAAARQGMRRGRVASPTWSARSGHWTTSQAPRRRMDLGRSCPAQRSPENSRSAKFGRRWWTLGRQYTPTRCVDTRRPQRRSVVAELAPTILTRVIASLALRWAMLGRTGVVPRKLS